MGGNERKELPFIENIVPDEGSLVIINDKKNNIKKIGKIKTIPTGLIVSNDVDINIIKKISLFKRQYSAVTQRHFADLHGFIDCEILNINGEWILNNTKQEAHNIIDMQEADENIQTEYLLIKES